MILSDCEVIYMRGGIVRAAALALLTQAPVNAAPPKTHYIWLTGMTGAKFMEICGPELQDFNLLSPCNSYMNGAMDGITIESLGKKWCPPQGGVTMQFQQVIYSYIKARPAEWHRPAILLVRDALTSTFPCSNLTRP